MVSRLTAKVGSVPRRVAQRFGWGLADQAMCSVSNAAVSFYVARELGATQFGAFSLAMTESTVTAAGPRSQASDRAAIRKLPESNNARPIFLDYMV